MSEENKALENETPEEAQPTEEKTKKPSKKSPAKASEIKKYEARVAELEEALDKAQDASLRAQAELQNFKRRNTEERIKDRQFANVDIMKKLLPILDHLEAALKNEGKKEAFEPFLKGFEMIYKNLLNALQTEGLTAIDALHQPFDPTVHQAVLTEPSDEHDSETVLEVLQKGYTFKERVLRPSMVKVSE